MFVRIGKSGQRAYVQIVESRRIGGTVRQSVIADLGRADALIASGALAAKRIGGPLLFGRLWQELGIGAVLEELRAARGFALPVARAVFIATLHRLFVSGSNRGCASWMADYDLRDAQTLCLHQFYRATVWLGEPIEEASEPSRTPRCVKDVIVG